MAKIVIEYNSEDTDAVRDVIELLDGWSYELQEELAKRGCEA